MTLPFENISTGQDIFWLCFGSFAQMLFFTRFLIQWIVSEVKKKSVIPISFWYLSIFGSLGLLAYALHRKDPVFIVGQSLGFTVYLRNLYFVYKKT